MAFIKQVWTLFKKNLLLLVVRSWFWTFIRAVGFPIVLAFILGYSKNWMDGGANYGVGSAFTTRSLDEALPLVGGSRSKVVFNDNGFKGGDIDAVINSVSSTFRDHGFAPIRVSSYHDVVRNCPANLQGATNCFGAVQFDSSPDHQSDESKNSKQNWKWDYTLMGDSTLRGTIDVTKDNNNPQVYLFPFQNAIDAAIINTNSSAKPLPNNIQNLPYTEESEKARQQGVTDDYQMILFAYMLILFFIAMVGITYHMVGFLATERESGLTDLIDTMMPSRNWYTAQTARFLSTHLAFDVVYLPGWMAVGGLLASYGLPDLNAGIIVLVHIITGLSLSSLSVLSGAFYKKAHLSGVTVVIITVVLAIAALYGINSSNGSTGAVIATSFLFPPMAYIFFLILAADAQINHKAFVLSKPHEVDPFGWSWSVSGATILGLMVVQIILFPAIGSLIETVLYGVSARGRTVTSGTQQPFAVRIRNLFIEYQPGKLSCRSSRKVVKAVNDLSLDWLPGSITCLLGVNGCGKTTVMNAIAGRKNIASGTIEVDGTGGFGICPQKNVMWGDLTVLEHIRIFSSIKNVANQNVTDSSIDRLVDACDLELKRHARSKTLSGGQKRKLQLAMMFAGGSRVCCIDEVSSGIDPLARRKIWDILLTERHTRSILLTTHYLEEADVLADHIAIMSKGTMKVEGSTVQLKSNLGGGYRVLVDAYVPPNLNLGPHLPHYDEGRQTHFTAQDASAVATLLRKLEQNGFSDYRVQDPTTENVFLEVSDELKDLDTAIASEVKSEAARQYEPLRLTPGTGISLPVQMWTLFKKRVTILRSSYMAYVGALFIPLCTAGLVTLFFKSLSYAKTGLQCATSGDPSYPYSLASYDFTGRSFVYGPENDPSLNILTSSVQGFSSKHLHKVINVTSVNEWTKKIHDISYLFTGGYYNEEESRRFAWVGDSYSPGCTEPALALNAANQIASGMPFRFGYSTFAAATVPLDTDKTIQIGIYMALALSVYPALFALYPTRERIRSVRALHYSNGIRSVALWPAYFLFDFVFVLVISILTIVIWSVKWDGWYGLGYVFVVMVLYGMTSILYSYCVSLFCKSQLGSFAASAGSQCVLMLVYFITYVTAQVYAPPDQAQDWLNYEYFTICLISPSGNMLRALLLTLNSFYILCRGDEFIDYFGDITAFGGPILYLILQFFALLGFLVYYDGGGRFRLFSRKPQNTDPEIVHGTLSSGAAEDPDRLKLSDRGIQIRHVSKRFGSVQALSDVNLGILPSETVALLGPNGAGKSTLMSLMRGDMRCSDSNGSITIEGADVISQRVTARSHLGVCGQFDACDALTVRQQLTFYASARGVPKSARKSNVDSVMRALGLTQYEYRGAWELSGGNQRKLSLGCALVGGPAVLLLDEPSSGMDPAAKRVLWRELKHISQGRMLLLSTHSMEEADALCERAVILARSVLALGTTEQLREREGRLHVHVVHRDAPHADAADMTELRHWVEQSVPGVRVEDRTYHGQLRFSVAQTENEGKNPVGNLFELMERNKEALGVAYYSIGRTTLDDVFLSVVRRHNVEEENYGVHSEKKSIVARVLKR